VEGDDGEEEDDKATRVVTAWFTIPTAIRSSCVHHFSIPRPRSPALPPVLNPFCPLREYPQAVATIVPHLNEDVFRRPPPSPQTGAGTAGDASGDAGPVFIPNLALPRIHDESITVSQVHVS
jgi:hypothetical protein